MSITQLIEEFTDCHDKEHREFLKTEIAKRTKEHIEQCVDYQIMLVES